MEDFEITDNAVLNLVISPRADFDAVHVRPGSPPPDWNNVAVLHRNRLPTRAHFHPHPTEVQARAAVEDAPAYEASVRLGHDTALRQLLSGEAAAPWKLWYTWGPHSEGPRIAGWRCVGFNDAKWDPVQVPGMWQCQGYGRGPQYLGADYPFPADLPTVPHCQNECGRYVTTFRVQDRLLPPPTEGGGRTVFRLRFEGVDSAFSVWLNDRYIGYSQGSRNPAEFAVGHALDLAGDNRLAVEVYQFCDGSYLESQPMWRLSGLFRDVMLCAWPAVHVADFWARTVFDGDDAVDQQQPRRARLLLDLQTTVAEPQPQQQQQPQPQQQTASTATAAVAPAAAAAAAPVRVALYDPSGACILERDVPADGPSTSTTEFIVERPLEWTAETPHLYTLTLTLPGASVAHRIGFRHISFRSSDGVLRVNGEPIKLRGVCRHEHHPDSGRTVPYEFMRRDLLMMKAHNINAVRTSHYPNDPRMYDVADEVGLWVMDEADIDCGGLVEQINWLDDGKKIPTADPGWEAAYLDRVSQMVLRDRNHACVLAWSLGGETFSGRNLAVMRNWVAAIDPTRPVHCQDETDARCADMASFSNPNGTRAVVAWARRHAVGPAAAQPWAKILLLSSFGRAAGNAHGSLVELVNTFYQFPALAGGFVWEWAGHGLRARDKDGRAYIGHGADSAEGRSFIAYNGDWATDVQHNDGAAGLDGLCSSEHQPLPGLFEYRKAAEPVQVVSTSGLSRGSAGVAVVTIVNRYDFLTLDHLDCVWRIAGELVQGADCPVAIPRGIMPGEQATLSLPLPPPVEFESHVQLSFRLREGTAWAPAGHEVATGELLRTPPRSVAWWRSTIDFDRRDCLTPVPIVPFFNRPCRVAIRSASGRSIWELDTATGQLFSWFKYELSQLFTQPAALGLYRPMLASDHPRDAAHWREARVHLARHQCRRVEWRETMAGIEAKVDGFLAPPGAVGWRVDTTTEFAFHADYVGIKISAVPRGLGLPSTFPRFGFTLGLALIRRVRWWGRGPGESYRDRKMSQRFWLWESDIDDMIASREDPQEGGNRTDVRWVEFWGPTKADPSILKLYFRANFGDRADASFHVSRVSDTAVDAARHPADIEQAVEKLQRKDRVRVLVRLDWAHTGVSGGQESRLRADEPMEVELVLT